MSPDAKRVRFDLLDGLRGLAAIAVMFFHFTSHNGLHWLPGAWIAVDLFFILSGLVIAHSYGKKLLAGMPLRQFLLIRLIRLGPLYFFGLLIGIFAALLALRAGELGEITPMQLGTAALLGATWLPYLNSLVWPFGSDLIVNPIFPLNDPAWSLFFEGFVNIAFVFYIFRFRSLSSVQIVGIAGAVYLANIIVFRQGNPGWGTDNFIFGFPRVLAEFFAGALIYQAGLHKRIARPKLTAFVLGAMALAVGVGGGKIALANSLTLMPLGVVLACAIKIESKAWIGVCKILGDLSYPLYIIHFPVYRLLWEVPQIRSLNSFWQTLLISCTCILLSLVLAVIDERLRKLLTARVASLQMRPSRQPSEEVS